ncbi:MAG: mucin desulfatase, partial [Acidobacteriota bacterium]|nr:mucin desulfatase [Acidobacteriota bacterium]
MSDNRNIGAVARQFQIRGKAASITPYGNGHINDTYCVVFVNGNAPERYILQHINGHIFKNPVALM